MTRRSVPRHPAEFGAKARRPAPRRGTVETAPGYGLPRWLRVGVFATIALVIGIVAVNLVFDRLQPPGTPEAGALQVHASMEGFDPNQLTVKVGQTVKIQLASMDTSMHSDGGGWHQFAIDELHVIPGLTLHGVHAHIGSQVFELIGFVESLTILSKFIAEDDFDELCIGGGLGVAYVTGESAPSIHEWGDAIRAAANEVGLDSKVRLLAEPGRAIVAQAAVTLYQVGAVKPVAQRTYMAVDGGMSDNPRPVLYGSGYEAFDVADPLARRPQNVRLVGKHCENGDVLIDEAWLPESTGVRSIIATPVTGAYGYSMASNYNRVPRPAVLFVGDGIAHEVLRRETFDDMARLEV